MKLETKSEQKERAASKCGTWRAEQTQEGDWVLYRKGELIAECATLPACQRIVNLYVEKGL